MFDKQTSAGYKIITIIPDWDREHVICKRTMSLGDDYVVGLGYHRDDGTWDQGIYSYDTVNEALEALIDAKFSYRKDSLIKRLLEYVEANEGEVEAIYKTLIGQIQMTESEIADWGYGYCIPEKEETNEND